MVFRYYVSFPFRAKWNMYQTSKTFLYTFLPVLLLGHYFVSFIKFLLKGNMHTEKGRPHKCLAGWICTNRMHLHDHHPNQEMPRTWEAPSISLWVTASPTRVIAIVTSRVFLLFPGHVHGVKQYVPVFSWYLSLNSMFVRSIYIIAYSCRYFILVAR